MMTEVLQEDRENATPHNVVAVALVLLFAAALRFYWNDVQTYFPLADEGRYLADVQILVERGIASYPAIVNGFLDNSARWVYPNPLRWGYLGVAALFCGITHDLSFRALATLSTMAGILSVLLTYLIGAELLERPAAIAGAALMATSPLQLALGRRALADELFCLAFLLSIFTLLRHLREEDAGKRARWLIGWIVATTFAIAVKEQFLMVYPIVLLFWWLRGGRRFTPRLVMMWVLPPLLYFSTFCLLSASLTKFFRVAWIITSVMGAPYASQYQSGPPHRILIDFLAIAPIVTIVAIVAAAFLTLQLVHREEGEWQLMILLAGILALHALLPSKNLRYLIEADPLFRLLAASFVWKQIRARGLGWPTTIAALGLNGAAELALFVTIFIRGGVYDPVTDTVLRALEMLPR
jgi:4-amino-4-deoxy-L-arabinose transferase-like glycosyltransferase